MIEKIKLRDKNYEVIRQGFYLRNDNVFFIREKEPCEFYISNNYSKIEHKLILQAMTENLERVENPDRYLEDLLEESKKLEETANWMKKILGPSYKPKKLEKSSKVSNR